MLGCNKLYQFKSGNKLVPFDPGGQTQEIRWNNSEMLEFDSASSNTILLLILTIVYNLPTVLLGCFIHLGSMQGPMWAVRGLVPCPRLPLKVSWLLHLLPAHRPTCPGRDLSPNPQLLSPVPHRLIFPCNLQTKYKFHCMLAFQRHVNDWRQNGAFMLPDWLINSGKRFEAAPRLHGKWDSITDVNI